MWFSNISAAEAAAAFAASSPDESAFGNSPGGRALRKARCDCDSLLFAAFADSPPSLKKPKPEPDSSCVEPPSFPDHDSWDAMELESTGEVEAAKLAEIAGMESEGSDELGDSDQDFASSSDRESCGTAEEDSDQEQAGGGQITQSTPQLAKGGPLMRTLGAGKGSSSLSSAPSGAATSTPGSTSLSPAESMKLLEASGWKLKGSLAKQRRIHEALCNVAFCNFKCSCLSALGNVSCLDNGFDRATFRSYHSRTYGRGSDLHALKQVKTAVHEYIWELRRPLPTASATGAQFEVPEWRLGGAGGAIVCKKAFEMAIGGSHFAHREALMLTRAGMAPSDQRAYKAASRATAVLRGKGTPRTKWAQSWWRQHLMYQDWLPNEVKIQYRGPVWTVVYDTFYAPVARLAGTLLKPKQWFRARGRALEAMHHEFFPSVSIHERKLTVTRSARHSKFPECTDCQRLRERYKRVVSNPKSTPEQIAEAYADLVAHAHLWQGDRETALDLRHRYSVLTSSARYSVDDKCGSFWQQLPVSDTGRDSKENAKDKYKFAVHANVVCGEQGHKMFTFVPKNIGTGANFGLTNLLMTILLAVKSGNLKPHTDVFVRHTDGGPDNVSVITHFIHWLLVYLGVFNKVLWFRFKAGHSHTEVADRLFAIIKRIFESDGAHRVVGVEDFPALIQKIEAEFQKETESCTFNWNFANWDLRTMMKEMNVVSSTLKGISSKMVYQYTYDEQLWQHGCVLVQYKSNISWKGSARDAEWSPITRVEREMNVGEADDEVEKVECNISRPKGVRFVTKPPDLRILPRREPFDPRGEKFSPAQQCRAIVNKRWGDLGAAARSFWKCLMLLHSNAGQVAEQVPDLPHTIHTDERAFTFDGTPRPFVDVVKAIMLRFPRPLLPADPFASEPAATWEAAENIRRSRAAAGAAPPGGESSEGADQPELRDPRRENTVENLELTAAEKRKEERALAEEEFATDSPARVEEVEVGQLYLAELEVAEHGLRLGLCTAQKEGPAGTDDTPPTWTVAWFKISSKNGWKTKNIAFEPYKKGGQRQTDVLDIESFRLQIVDTDLTKAGKANKDTNPKFTGEFREKVLAFARAEELDEHETEDEISPVEESDGEVEEEEDIVTDDSGGDGDSECEGGDDEEEEGEEEAAPPEPAAPPASSGRRGSSRALRAAGTGVAGGRKRKAEDSATACGVAADVSGAPARVHSGGSARAPLGAPNPLAPGATLALARRPPGMHSPAGSPGSRSSRAPPIRGTYKPVGAACGGRAVRRRDDPCSLEAGWAGRPPCASSPQGGSRGQRGL